MITIKNESLTASFLELGAELRSLKMNDVEYIFPADPQYWASSAPTMFPICSGVINDEYTLGGKKYHLTKHGFAKLLPFEVEEQKADAVTFLLKATEETLKMYPYNFEFRIHYVLEGKTLRITHDVRNADGKEMYFSVGSHEAYYTPEGIEDYELLLPEKQTLISTTLTGPNTLGYEQVTVCEDTDVLPLKYDFFAVDALVFQEFKGDNVILRNKKTGRSVKVTFKDIPYLLLWTKGALKAPYICIEPWNGIADRDDSDGIFEHKQGIQHINAGEIYTKEHSIEIL